jgi:hypothetical protein
MSARTGRWPSTLSEGIETDQGPHAHQAYPSRWLQGYKAELSMLPGHVVRDNTSRPIDEAVLGHEFQVRWH